MKKIILLAFIAFVPQITNAGVYISEIMYDLDGTDSDREWVEVHNDTDSVIDLSSYYLYENNVSHKITGNDLLESGEYGVIVDSVDKFMEDWPNYSGKIYDSVFSLNNSGEELVLQNELKETVDNFSYSPDLGAAGTGNSLQYNDGFWIPGDPTPGEINVTEPENEIEENETVDNSDVGNESTHSGQNEISDYKPKVIVKTGLGRNRIVSINTPIEFEVYKSENEKGKYFWNFGDGNSDKGKKVKHIYEYPGKYNLILNSVFSSNNNTSRVSVNVFEPQIDVIQEENKIGLKNNSENEFNAGGFILELNDNEKKIIKDTIISKGHTLFFETDERPMKVLFKYPNGETYYSNSKERAEAFCKKASAYGLNCNVEKMTEIFDRI
jgi:hypothetical protein